MSDTALGLNLSTLGVRCHCGSSQFMFPPGPPWENPRMWSGDSCLCNAYTPFSRERSRFYVDGAPWGIVASGISIVTYGYRQSRLCRHRKSYISARDRAISLGFLFIRRSLIKRGDRIHRFLILSYVSVSLSGSREGRGGFGGAAIDQADWLKLVKTYLLVLRCATSVSSDRQLLYSSDG